MIFQTVTSTHQKTYSCNLLMKAIPYS